MSSRWKYSAKKGKIKSGFCSFWHRRSPIPNFYSLLPQHRPCAWISFFLSPERITNSAHGDCAREIVVLYHVQCISLFYICAFSTNLCTTIIEKVYPQNFALPFRLCCVFFFRTRLIASPKYLMLGVLINRKQIFSENKTLMKVIKLQLAFFEFGIF